MITEVKVVIYSYKAHQELVKNKYNSKDVCFGKNLISKIARLNDSIDKFCLKFLDRTLRTFLVIQKNKSQKY